MAGTTVRIRSETREVLRELERLTGSRTPELLARAVERLRDDLLLEQTNAAYAALRADPGAWAALQAERELWDATLADGLDDAGS